MGTAYSTQAVSGYNSNPPADDGTQTDANKVKWSSIKTKLGDPLNVWADAVDDALVLAFNYSVNSQTGNYTTVEGDHMKTVEVASNVSSAVTISLGDAATMGASYMVRVKNSGTSTVTVGRATSGDTIDGAAKNLTLGPSQSAWFAVSGSGYMCVTGNPPIYDATDPSKSIRFVCSGITTGTQRLITIPDGDITLVPAASPTFTGTITANADMTLSGDLTVNGNTVIGNASSDTIAIRPNAVTWTNNPTHSGNHTWSGTHTINSAVLGAWTAPAFDAGNFTASGSMTWTVAEGDVTTYAYEITNKKMTVSFRILTSTVGGTPSNELRIAIPASKTATKGMDAVCFITDNSVVNVGRCYVDAAGTYIGIARSDSANFTASTNASSVRGQITFEID